MVFTIPRIHTTYAASVILGLVQQIMMYLNMPLLKRQFRYFMGRRVDSRQIPGAYTLCARPRLENV